MKIYSLRRVQTLPIRLADAWDFFSSPNNLSLITPQGMGFTILSCSGGDKMYPGQLIAYKIVVLQGIRVNWLTEITQAHEPHYFIDEQRFGPYAFWHHQHHFRETAQGVEMIDEISYALPFGILGQLVNRLFVERRVNAIFDYRFNTLSTYFDTDKTKFRKQA